MKRVIEREEIWQPCFHGLSLGRSNKLFGSDSKPFRERILSTFKVQLALRSKILKRNRGIQIDFTRHGKSPQLQYGKC